MQDVDKKTGYHTASVCLLGFVLVYFLFPVVFVLPCVVLGMSRPPPALETFLKPVNHLYTHVPPYRALIDLELKLVERWR